MVTTYQYHERKGKALCVQCGLTPPHASTLRCGECLKHNRVKQQRQRDDHKAKVFTHYGRQCACCGETEPLFLSLDHMDNNGYKHRKEIGTCSDSLYCFLIRKGFPPTFQVLCMNCNHGQSRNGGVCPHKAKGTK